MTGSTAVTDNPGTGDLGWAVSVVFRAYVTAARVETADLPGGPRCHQVLAAVAREQPGSQSALAHRLGIDRTVMTYLLDDLVRAGLVERQPDPADRRNRRVVATGRGRRVLADLDRRLRHAEEQLLAGLDEPDRDTLRRLLHRVAAYVDERDPIGHPCAAIEDLSAQSGEVPGGEVR